MVIEGAMGNDSKNRRMRKTLTIVLVLCYTIAFGQTDSVKNLISDQLEIVIKDLKAGKSRYTPELNKLLTANPEFSYSALKNVARDSNDFVLEGILNYSTMLKSSSEDSVFRQKITYDLLQIYKQRKKPLNSYNTFDIPSELSDLERSKASDFNADARELLGELLQDSLINKRILKVVGIAKMQDQIPELRKFLPEGERYRKPSNGRLYFLSWEWYARLAMARLGDQEQIGYCVEKIESSEEDIMSNHHAAGDYFDDLIYIKQPEVLPFLFEMLISSNEFAGDPIYTTTYYASNALYKLLEEFPHDPDVVKYSEKSLKNLEKWVRENKGNYEFKQ